MVDVRSNKCVHFLAIKSAFLDEMQETEKLFESPKEHFVFLVHGIRDYGGWTRVVSEELKGINPSLRDFSFRYGYFNILHFLLPAVRKNRARQFVDRYANEFSKNPESTFHFVGHSNGTFLLAEALKTYPGVQFESVYLAGSVVSGRFNWLRVFEREQVKRLRNDRANKDTPVGFLCGFLKSFYPDLGLGGFRGFQRLPTENAYELDWVEGGHGEAVSGQKRASSIARWVLENETTLVEPKTSEPKTWMNWLSKLALPVGLAAIVLLVYLGVLAAQGGIIWSVVFVCVLLIILLFI